MRRPAIVVLAAVWLALRAAAQETPPEKPQIPTEGFWPTKTMVQRILDRISDDMAREYEFDEYQKDRAREVLGERIPKFMQENRAEIQQLMNEFIEAQLHDEAPTVEAVQVWSSRVLPLVDKFTEMADTVTGSLREVMTDEQVVKLDSEMAAFQTGIGLVRQKLGAWSEGGYDPETEWTSPGPERRRREREEQREMEAKLAEARAQAAAESAARDAGAGGAASRPVAASRKVDESDEWTRYTAEFIRRYDLNDEQKQKAQTILKMKQEERDRYLKAKADDMERVTKAGRDAQSDDEKRSAKEAADRLNAPVERMFAQLKDRLDALPTRAQRQAVAKREIEALAATQPAEKQP